MTLLDAARQALKALETNNEAWKHLADSGDAGFWEAEEQPFYEMSAQAITALRQAIDQAQQCVMENAQGELERVSLVQTGVGIGKPEQEPVATWENHFGMKEWQVHALRAGWSITPPQRKPLTDEEIVALFNRLCQERSAWPERRYRDFARWVERAHGIGGGE
jgi:hypothetical protein